MTDNANDVVASEENVAPVKPDTGLKLREVYRLHHNVGGGYTDFESESDLLDFVSEATTVTYRKEPDGSKTPVFSVNAHLVHGAAHPDFPNLTVDRVNTVEFPEDDN